jgi:hypothetical protein
MPDIANRDRECMITMNRRRFLTATAAAAAMLPFAGVRAQIDPYNRVVNMAQRRFLLTLPAPPRPFDITAQAETEYHPQLLAGVAAYEDIAAAERAYAVFLSLLATALPRMERIEPDWWEMAVDEAMLYQQFQEGGTDPTTSLYVRQGDVVHVWPLDPGGEGSVQGPTEEPMRQIAEYVLIDAPGGGPYGREALLRLLPSEEQIESAVTDIARATELDEHHGEA